MENLKALKTSDHISNYIHTLVAKSFDEILIYVLMINTFYFQYLFLGNEA